MHAPTTQGIETTRAPSPTRRRWKAWAIQVLLFALIWANIELYCARHLRTEGFETPAAMGVLDPATGNWMLSMDGADRNEDGIKNPSVPLERAPREIRIFCLGGSTTMGWGVAPPDAYVRQFEKLVQRHAPAGVKITAINGAIPGFGSSQCMTMLLRLGPKYRPQIVTAMCGFNERNSILYRPSSTDYEGSWVSTSLASAGRFVLYKSPTYRYLRRKLRSEVTPADSELPVSELAVSNVRHIQRYLAQRDVRFLLMFETQSRKPETVGDPRRVNGAERERMRQMFRQLADEEGFPFLDIDDQLLGRSGRPEGDMILDQTHLTVEGNRICAETLAEKMWELGWLPRADRANPTGTNAPR